MDTEIDELNNLLGEQTENTKDPTCYDIIAIQDFKQMIQDHDVITLENKIVIIDDELVIDKILVIQGIQKVILRFIGNGCFKYDFRETTLQFELKISSIINCVIDGQTINDQLFRVYSTGLELRQCICIAEAKTIVFTNHLYILTSQLQGIALNFIGTTVDLQITDSVISRSSINVNQKSIIDGQIQIENNQIDASNYPIIIGNAKYLNVRIIKNYMFTTKIAVQISNMSLSDILIDGNYISDSTICGINLENLTTNSLSINNNQIIGCQVGIKLFDIRVIKQFNDELNLQVLQFQHNQLKAMNQTALILRNVIAISIQDCIFTENTIAIDLQLSTIYQYHHETLINPFLITIHNCLITFSQLHGIFACSQLQDNPIYLLISQTTFKRNNKIMNVSHLGEKLNKKSNLHNNTDFQITIYSCLFQENVNNQIQNSNYNIQIMRTNTIKVQKQGKSLCNIF